MTARCSIVIANAGSGKTWTLANRIIRWSLDEVRAGRTPEPARVLAVTFTRKAAGEILARILAHAAQGAAEGAAGAKARSDFESVVGPASEAEYLAVLQALCRDLHRLQVGTIDGFFNRIASAMPAEIGLPAHWSLGDDRALNQLRAQAAAEVLADEGAEHLVALLERGEPKPSVTTAITALLGGTTITPLDIYRATAAGGSEAMGHAGSPAGKHAGKPADNHAWKWIDKLSRARDLTMEQFDLLAERVSALTVPLKKDGQPDGRWASALDGVVEIVRARDFRALAGSNFFAKMHRGESYHQVEMPGDFTELAGLIEPHLRKALVDDIARQLEGALSVLPRASDALERLQHEQGVYGFGDIGRGVARAASRRGSRLADPAQLRAALGADIRDLAIDEAQDTSVEQFVSLRPLLEEVLTGTRDGRFLLVGDPKQSIYGWRGGTPGLIAHIEQGYARHLGPGVALTRSFRSSPLVMDLVNRVFGNLSDDLLHFVEDAHKEPLVGLHEWAESEGLPSDCLGSAFKRAVRDWPFARHESAKPSLAGVVTASAYGKIKGADGVTSEVTAAACAAAIAARLSRARPARSIGVLVRTNREVTDVIAELKLLGVAASDEGSAKLLDSPAVARVVAMLRLIDDPGDRISHFLISRGAMQAVTGLAEFESHGDPGVAERAAQAFAARWRAQIADRGLAAVLRDVFNGLAQQGLAARDESRLARVIAIADDRDERPVARLTEFIDEIAADKADSSSADRVRVMTVHRSKGLEFDDVVLASLDDGWGSAPTDWGMLVTSPTEPPKMVSPLANEAVRTWVPELAVFERDERRRGVLDDLSTLYVALTRARTGLHLVMKAEQGGKLPTAAKLIVRAIDRARDANADDALGGAPEFAGALAGATPDAQVSFWSHGFGQQGGSAADEPSDAMAEDGAAPKAESPSPGPPVTPVSRARTRAAAPSTHAPDGLWQFDPFGDDDIALRGVLVHECFREVESFSPVPSAADCARLVARAARRASVEKGTPIPPALIEEVAGLVGRIAASPLGRALRAGPFVRVHTELPFVRETPGGLVHGRIDRLELELDSQDGRVIGAVIIDFKTGATRSAGEEFERKKRAYFEQLAGYRDAVAEMFALAPEAIGLTLLFVDRGSVESVGVASGVA